MPIISHIIREESLPSVNSSNDQSDKPNTDTRPMATCPSTKNQSQDSQRVTKQLPTQHQKIKSHKTVNSSKCQPVNPNTNTHPTCPSTDKQSRNVTIPQKRKSHPNPPT
eukprot:11244_1